MWHHGPSPGCLEGVLDDKRKIDLFFKKRPISFQLLQHPFCSQRMPQCPLFGHLDGRLAEFLVAMLFGRLLAAPRFERFGHFLKVS